MMENFIQAEAHFIFANSFTSKSYYKKLQFHHTATKELIVSMFQQTEAGWNYVSLSSVNIGGMEVWNYADLFNNK